MIQIVREKCNLSGNESAVEELEIMFNYFQSNEANPNELNSFLLNLRKMIQEAMKDEKMFC